MAAEQRGWASAVAGEEPSLGAGLRAGVGVRPGPSRVAGELPADGRIIDAVELADRVKQDLTVAMKAGEKGRVRPCASSSPSCRRPGSPVWCRRSFAVCARAPLR